MCTTSRIICYVAMDLESERADARHRGLRTVVKELDQVSEARPVKKNGLCASSMTQRGGNVDALEPLRGPVSRWLRVPVAAYALVHTAAPMLRLAAKDTSIPVQRILPRGEKTNPRSTIQIVLRAAPPRCQSWDGSPQPILTRTNIPPLSTTLASPKIDSLAERDD